MKNYFVIGAVIVVGVVVYFFSNNFHYVPPSSDEVAKNTFSETGEIKPLYFFSYGAGSTTEKCPATKNIDWELAIYLMSDYWEYGAGSSTTEFDREPAEIQRSFNENCERNMGIYADAIEKNPHLLERKSKAE